MNRSIDIGKAITFVSEDEKWLEKLGIGTALVLISTVLSVVLVGIVGFIILAGYSVRLLQNVRDGVAKPLPEWDRWSEDLASGFKLVVAILVYALPAFVFAIPIAIGTFIANQGSDSAQIIGLPFVLGGACLILVYSIMLFLMTPGISVAFAKDETIQSALRFSAIWDWTRDRIGMVLIVAAVNIGASMVLGLVAPLLGVLLCVIGVLVTLPLATLLQYLILYHMYGQLASDSPDRLGYGVPASYPVSPAAPVVPGAPTVSGVPVEPGSTPSTWFEEALAEEPPMAVPSSPASDELTVSITPGDHTPGDTTASELGDIPNRPDDRPNLPQNPT